MSQTGLLKHALAALAVVLAFVMGTVVRTALPVPWSHKGPGGEVAIEQWQLVGSGRLWTDVGADVLAFSPADGHSLLTISEKGMESWEVADAEHPERVSVGGLSVKAGVPLGITPDGRMLVVADGRNVLGVRTDTGQRTWSINEPRDNVKAIHASRYGVMLAVSDATRSTRLRSASPGDADGTPPTARGQIPLGARTAQFSPDGETVAIATGDGTLHLWDISSSGAPRRAGPPFTSESGGTTALAFSSDGSHLAAVGADHVVRLWDVENPKQPRYLGSPLAPNTPVTALAFSRDPRLVATVGTDHTAYLWRRE